MNIENIKALAKIVTEHELTGLEFEDDDVKIRLKREINTAQSVPAAVSPVLTAVPETFAVGAPAVSAVAKTAQNAEPAVDHSRLTEVKSPLVGVFYSAPSPDAEPFVTLGSKVKKGDVLCIVEAMKLMNEINAEQDGEIVDICIKNGDIAEFGQVLFKMS